MLSNVLDQLKPVSPTRPPAPYIGGKKMLAKRLVAQINAVPHRLYAEPFVGMGGVFFRRDQRPKCEVINDWSEDVATFFRILQRHYVAFMDMLRWQVTSRAGFERLRGQDPSTLTDLERAARFLYLQKLTFGGKVAGRVFGVDTGGPARFDVAKVGPVLEAAHERLSSVVIERLPWADFVARYDRPGTLFYLDPPYFGCETDYGRDLFDRDQFEAMADQLRDIKGRFILSLNDRPEVRRIFDGFTMEAVPVRYTVGGMAQSRVVGEVIISN
ncbi:MULTISPECIES: DNA adenine methylase [unclassified Novosphingobium]|uniref:DNA adenine methylase n=1 Tax=unclassified Novosphingobium TaxID=2644732 RepID=UPI000D30471D|nr:MULTISPECIES: DNA adenine methylase [unclassified Novosphingobium]PTR05141.1 DNA adenine methylase [Novosphingobium sp. GV055]PUA93748.1 DNA adenine methylase [Novosphingobium sp. GV061]PUB10371.1 DNA adenine methylase [Novosphingobium sp. GV079]PUB36451.1 DNA adenine methylase [Novosphingobium sp. GV027]